MAQPAGERMMRPRMRGKSLKYRAEPHLLRRESPLQSEKTTDFMLGKLAKQSAIYGISTIVVRF
jgi:hypothetical protein